MASDGTSVGLGAKFAAILVRAGLDRFLGPGRIIANGNAALRVELERERWRAQSAIEVEKIASGEAKVIGDVGNSMLVSSGIEVQAPNPGQTFKVEPTFYLGVVSNQLAISAREEVNVEQCLRAAEDAIEGMPDRHPDKELDVDWFLNWRSGACAVSTETMQVLWGKVLAGELETPGQISLRTLDFLRSCGKDEAKALLSTAPLVIDDGMLGDDEFLGKHGFDFGRLTYFQEMGIIHGFGQAMAQRTYSADRGADFWAWSINFFGGYSLRFLAPQEVQSVVLPLVMLTRVGKDLMKIINAAPNIPAVHDVAQYVLAQNPAIEACYLTRITNELEGEVVIEWLKGGVNA